MLTLTHATERDVDLLLVEEFSCNPDFVQWLAGKLSAKLDNANDFQFSKVTHSRRRMHNRREIDMTLELHGPSTIEAAILIENKLDTDEQVRQAESYAEEAMSLVEHGKAKTVITVLVCPADYAASHRSFATKFGATITYEEISGFLRDRSAVIDGEPGHRAGYRHRLLEQAIQKQRRGYEAVPLPVIGSFNKEYVALCRQCFPDLVPGPSMTREDSPAESKTTIFAPSALPDWSFLPRMRLVHQLREGNANVNFFGWGDFFTALAARMGADLADTPFKLIPTLNKRRGGRAGLMIVADTPEINNVESFAVQRDAILAGMKVTADLRAWIFDHKDAVRGWAEIVEKQRARHFAHLLPADASATTLAK